MTWVKQTETITAGQQTAQMFLLWHSRALRPCHQQSRRGATAAAATRRQIRGPCLAVTLADSTAAGSGSSGAETLTNHIRPAPLHPCPVFTVRTAPPVLGHTGIQSHGMAHLPNCLGRRPELWHGPSSYLPGAASRAMAWPSVPPAGGGTDIQSHGMAESPTCRGRRPEAA